MLVEHLDAKRRRDTPFEPSRELLYRIKTLGASSRAALPRHYHGIPTGSVVAAPPWSVSRLQKFSLRQGSGIRDRMRHHGMAALALFISYHEIPFIRLVVSLHFKHLRGNCK
jgi:hypothetical protein